MLQRLLFFALILCATTLYSQVENSNSLNLTGNLNHDSKLIASNAPLIIKNRILPEPAAKKSPALGGLLSLVIPGAGDFYAEHYIEAGIFAALEVGAIVTAIHYNNKGNSQTDYFQSVADSKTGWDVTRYAAWLNSQISDSTKLIYINPNTSLNPWERVDWNQINAVELGSHKLPPHGEQQYYELIGKYNQYNPGWADYEDLVKTNPLYNPEVGQGSTIPTELLKAYAGYRGKANDFYDVASHAVIALYINHFLSALDAVWSTISYNRSISVHSSVEPQTIFGYTEYVSHVTLTFAF